MSNGSERTPERCVHAPVGPDWAGLRELPTPKPNYQTLAQEMRAFQHSHEVQSDATTVGGVWRPNHAEQAKRYKSYADAIEALLGMEQRLTDHIVQLAAERDALDKALWVAKESQADLIKENEKIAAGSVFRDTIETQRDYIAVLTAERDALRAQLDSMTVEWGVGGGSRVLTADSEKTARSAAAMHASTPLVNRLVSPWTVVEGDDQ